MSKTPARKYDEPLTLDMSPDEALQRFANVNVKDVETEIPDIEGKACPFVRWMGGKRSIVRELTSRLPKEFGNYYEPFAGGSALFFEICDTLTKQVFLSDVNFDLIITYNVIKRELNKLLVALAKHAENHGEAYYYKIRGQHHLQDPIEIAARFLYLNKTCYNGLWRVNRKGEFNVPMGSYAKPGIMQEANLRLCSRTLKNVFINLRAFDEITPEKGDLVYFDPPYHPTNDTSFTGYAKMDFAENDQTALAEFAIELHKKGVLVMLSNSNTKFIRTLYKSSIFKVAIVNDPRYVNCKPSGRSNVEEVLVTNY